MMDTANAMRSHKESSRKHSKGRRVSLLCLVDFPFFGPQNGKP